MNRLNFIATEVGSEINNGILYAGVAEEYGPQIIFQRILDVENYNDECPSFEYCKGCLCGYGIIMICKLSRNIISLDFTEGCHHLEGKIGIDAQLKISDKQWKSFKYNLVRVFVGYEQALKIIE